MLRLRHTHTLKQTESNAKNENAARARQAAFVPRFIYDFTSPFKQRFSLCDCWLLSHTPLSTELKRERERPTVSTRAEPS